MPQLTLTPLALNSLAQVISGITITYALLVYGRRTPVYCSMIGIGAMAAILTFLIFIEQGYGLLTPWENVIGRIRTATGVWFTTSLIIFAYAFPSPTAALADEARKFITFIVALNIALTLFYLFAMDSSSDALISWIIYVAQAALPMLIGLRRWLFERNNTPRNSGNIEGLQSFVIAFTAYTLANGLLITDIVQSEQYILSSFASSAATAALSVLGSWMFMRHAGETMQFLGVMIVVFVGITTILMSLIGFLLGEQFVGQPLLIDQLLQPIAWTMLGAMILISLGAPLLLRGVMLRPMRLLLAGVERVAAGQLDTRIPTIHDDEIGYLARGFNEMVGSVQAAQLELVEANASLEERVVARTVELAAARDSADSANQAKSRFLANMSHELRSPLNAVLGYAQLLERDQVDAQLAAAIIQQSGNHLLTLIDDVLEIAKIEVGKVTLTPAPLRLNHFLQNVVETARLEAESKQLTFISDVALTPAIRVSVDEKRLRQVLTNLLGNAIKFTDSGIVALRVSQAGETFSFGVEDSGEGVPTNELAAIFEPFHQLPLGVEQGGTGLGLAISQQLVELMGGELKAVSELGNGAVFSFELALLVVDDGKDSAEFSPSPQIVGFSQRSPQIFAVDDNPSNLLLLETMLKPLGFAVETFDKANQLLQAATSNTPDVVLVDLAMPKTSGHNLLQQLRQNPTTANCFIIATSTSVYPTVQQASLAAGAEHFLPKPLVLNNLLQLLGDRFALKWQFADGPQSEYAPMVLPEQVTLQRLIDFANSGDVFAVQDVSTQLAQSDPKLMQFTECVVAFTSNFQLKKLVSWLTDLNSDVLTK